MPTIPELETELELALAAFGAEHGRYGSLEHAGKTEYGKHVVVYLPTGYGKPSPTTVAAIRAIVERYFGGVTRVILPSGISHFGSASKPAKYAVVFVQEDR